MARLLEQAVFLTFLQNNKDNTTTCVIFIHVLCIYVCLMGVLLIFLTRWNSNLAAGLTGKIDTQGETTWTFYSFSPCITPVLIIRTIIINIKQSSRGTNERRVVEICHIGRVWQITAIFERVWPEGDEKILFERWAA